MGNTHMMLIVREFSICSSLMYPKVVERKRLRLQILRIAVASIIENCRLLTLRDKSTFRVYNLLNMEAATDHKLNSKGCSSEIALK